MWVVAKIKKNEIGIFKQKLIEKIGKDISFYCPKMQYQKYYKNKLKTVEKFILENYIFCYHEKFSNINLTYELRCIKGLKYFLHSHDKKNQNEILHFIDYCKSYENAQGYIAPAFFKKIVFKKAIFASGPFANMMFEIIEKQTNKLKILINNIVVTVSDNKNYLYHPV